MNYTNLGTMAYDRIASIRSQEMLHWYLGLRQAELEIESNLKPALKLARTKLDDLAHKITEARNLGSDFEVGKLEVERDSILRSMHGAISELQAAEEEKARIVAEHQSELMLPAQELERRVARDCYLAKCARRVAIASIRALGYNEQEAGVLIELTPEDRLEVMGMIHPSNHQFVVAITNALDRVPEIAAQEIVGLVEAQVMKLITTGEQKHGVA
jgi:hypothetical protein